MLPGQKQCSLNALRYVSCLKTRTKDYLIGHQKLAENFFQPLTISGTEQSKRPGEDILFFEDPKTDDTAALQCYYLLFPFLREVFIISMTISHEKKRTLKVFLMVTLTTVYSRNMKQHLYFTQEGCRSGMLAQVPMLKEWYLCQGTHKAVRLRVPSSAVSKVSACAGW